MRSGSSGPRVGTAVGGPEHRLVGTSVFPDNLSNLRAVVPVCPTNHIVRIYVYSLTGYEAKLPGNKIACVKKQLLSLFCIVFFFPFEM